VSETRQRRWSALPATRSSAPILKTRLYTVIGAVGVCAALGPLSLVLNLAQGDPPPAAVSVNTTADGYARTVAEDFLSARPTSVPVATDIDATFGLPNNVTQRKPLTYSGLTLVASDSHAATTVNPAYTVSKFLFQLVAADGTAKAMKLDVTMLATADGPVLAAQPTLRAADLTSAGYDPLDFNRASTFVSGSPSPAVGTVIDAWAKAMAEGDDARLTELTRDPAGGKYSGLSGFTLAKSPQILSYVSESATAVSSVKGVNPEDPTYVRVRIWLQADSADGYVVSSDYDVLIFATKSSAPYPVAWGAPGTDPEPFSNSNRH
jgi:hypothetical protein